MASKDPRKTRKRLQAEPPDEPYALTPPGPSPTDYQPEIYPRYNIEEESSPAKERFQFTIGEMLWLTTAVAIALGILGLIPGGRSAEGMAGFCGLGLLVSLVVLAIVQPTRPIVRVAWWVFLGFYVLASLAAVIQGLLGRDS
jgi:hypothetical protein